MPHHSGPFDDTDHCQDAEALSKPTVWLENGIKTEDSAFSKNTHGGRLCVCLVFIVYWQDLVTDNLISIDYVIIYNLH